MIFLYNLLVFVLLPLWLLFLWRSQKKLVLKDRLGFLPKRKDNPLWIHSVSLGEVKIALTLIDKLKEKGFNLFLTTTTSSGMGEFQRRRTNCCFFPIDFILFMKIALSRVKPSALILIETEIWPSLFYLCSKNRIPIFILNARLSEKKLKYYKIFKVLFADIISKVWILVSSKEYEKRYIEIGADNKKILKTGNMKFDIKIPTNEELSKYFVSVRDFMKEDTEVWIAGSVREGEEEKIIKCQKKLMEVFNNLRLIIAPRHINRVGKIIELCYKEGLRVVLRSEFPSKDWDVFILDTYGELIYTYSFSKISFVGGSLVDFGGQNPLEPALFKNCVIIGENYKNFLDEVKFLEENRGVVIVKNEEELFSKIKYIFENEEDRRFFGENSYNAVMECKGATDKNVEFISNILCYQNGSCASLIRGGNKDD